MRSEEIDPELLMLVLTGEGTAADRLRVDAWRAADPSHDRQYRAIERLWRSADRVAAERASVPSASEIVFKAAAQCPDPGGATRPPSDGQEGAGGESANEPRPAHDRPISSA